MKALILDDETALCDIIASVLARSGVDHLSFEDPVAALAALDNDVFDAAFVDIGLPNMDGLEFAKRFRARCPDSDVIFITGTDDFDQAVKAIKVGAYDFVRKPFQLSEIQACVMRLIEKRRLYASDKRREILEFANEMSMELMHELRNPLMIIGGFSKRACNVNGQEDKLKDYARIIFDQSMRVEKALNQVLAHLRTGAGKEEPEGSHNAPEVLACHG